jgi:uncharacterized protein (TIGR03067 family)
MRIGVIIIALALPLLLLPAFVAGQEAKKDEAVQEELKKFEGTWKLTSIELAGQKTELPPEKSDQTQLVFKGTKLTMKGGPKGDSETTFSIDPTKKPPQIDIQPPKGEKKALTGIYKFDKDMLIICGSENGERPTDFASKEGTSTGIMTLEKVKDKPKDKD